MSAEDFDVQKALAVEFNDRGMVKLQAPVGEGDAGEFLLAVVESDRLLKDGPAGQEDLGVVREIP
ncbi:MAG: hypothetical protein HY211_02980, partial [Candidatus Omnitrophica bacterium]|nr:hypothetical protein [Candidatus Omnitrophota bacterium]